MKILHTHHIIPKHMGGTDDPSNLVELTIEEHAEAHRILFEQHGKIEDFLAWKALIGILKKKDIVYILSKIRADSELNPWRGNKTRTNFALDNENQIKASKSSTSLDSKSKRKETFKRINHQAGEKNSNFGNVWCVEVNAENLKNRKRFKPDEIPNGWIKSIDWKISQKNKNSPNFGKTWFNDGVSNFLLVEDNSGRLKKGRLGKLFQNGCKQ